jgi:hypothetical protein
MNPRLTKALEMMREKFPNAACFTEESLNHIHGDTMHSFRLSIVNGSVVDAGQGATIEEAFAKLVASSERDRTQEIEKAKRMLESAGFAVTPKN